MKLLAIIIAFLSLSSFASAQNKSVAITMDDLLYAYDNMSIHELEEANKSLLKSIAKHKIPVTVFINENSFIKTGETERRLSIYKKWINNPFVTVGNHTYSHKNYSETTSTEFEKDIIKGEVITKELLNKNDKHLKYFRFPYNCTGKDSISREEIFSFLKDRGYTITPFTIESLDYIYNSLYC